MNRSSRGLLFALLLGALATPLGTGAATLGATVRGDGGDPVQDAVVYLLPVDGDGHPVPLPPPTVVDQVDKEFVPYVTAVKVGTEVSFPNHDDIRHHVYSFSEAKSFEIPLYEGTPRELIVFDRPGVVPLGCNIHDWMMAYVFVSETPYFALSQADGRATVPDLPAGDYAAYVWHPQLKGAPEDTIQRISVGAEDGSSLAFTIQRKRVWRPRRAPSTGGGSSYR